ncbi:nidogen-like domain-containing protein [Spirosoma luteolum]
MAQTPANWNPSDNDPGYDARKQQAQTTAGSPVAPRSQARVALPACFEPYDTTAGGGWTRLPRQDDNSIGPIALGWDFSLFGSVYNSVYINTNGNITFSAPLSQYTATGFPISTPMVAPFWSDVDTRNPSSGSVWYKVYPDRLVVTWSFVGYYPSQADKKNTFQLVIKANTDPGFSGNDVFFSYGDMQWTTGSASGGSGGFGGAPATVGINRGNGIDYIQTGRFNINGNQPPNVPSLGSPGGIDWLDGQCFAYRLSGSAGNLAPTLSGLPANNALSLNQGQTATLPLQATGPETNQNVHVSVDLGALCNSSFIINGNDTPNPTITVATTGSPCNVGTSPIVFTLTDNGTPAATQTYTLSVTVNPPPPTNQAPVFNGPLPNQTGTTGVSLSYSLPPGTFTDANGDALTYSASGLPPGLTFDGATFGGIPTASGSFNVTITATDPGQLSTTGTLLFVIGTTPPANQPPAFNGPLPTQNGTTGISFSYTLPPGAFTDPNGDMLTYAATDLPPGLTFSGTTLSGLPTTPGTYNVLLTATDPGTLVANGSITIIISSTPPTPGGFGFASIETVSCQVFSNSERQLTLLPKYTGLNGQPISFSIVNEMLPTTQAGPYTLRLYTDNPVITLSATQTGSPGPITFAFNWLATCGGPVLPPTPVPGSFTITSVNTIACASVTASERMLTFTPVYTGLTGQPVTFSVVNELSPTTAPGPYTLRVYTDNPTITLKAAQAGTPGDVTFSYNWLSLCNSNSRLSAEATSRLAASVYPNPVGSELVVQIQGARGQAVRLRLTNLAGQPVGERMVTVDQNDQRETLPMGQQPPGLYLLRVSTATQTVSLKVIKQ